MAVQLPLSVKNLTIWVQGDNKPKTLRALNSEVDSEMEKASEIGRLWREALKDFSSEDLKQHLFSIEGGEKIYSRYFLSTITKS